MRLKLQNILKVESADIEIGGLTVLTGENDSGKSTVGKILFSIIKAANNVRRVDRMKTASLIRSELVSIKRIFDSYDSTPLSGDMQDLSLNLTDSIIHVTELRQVLEAAPAERGFSSRMTAIMRNGLARIDKYIVKLNNPEDAVREVFESIVKSEFMESINSYSSESSRIFFHDETTGTEGNTIEIDIEDGKSERVSLSGNPSLEDITYIESPLYLHILNTLRLSSPLPTESLRGLPTSLRRDNIPYHLADMAEKLLSNPEEISLFSLNLQDDYRSQLEEINTVIGGEFILNNKTKQLSFRQNGLIVPSVSIASGIKSFGVLQRLLQTDSISTYKMLIWDEPEIHLHPEWQIVFSKLIIELVADGIPIVVSSHSPYFVQALRYFASAKGIEKDVRYYMAQVSGKSGLSVVREVTDDLNSVFALLAAPLREIMNVDAVRNSMI